MNSIHQTSMGRTIPAARGAGSLPFSFFLLALAGIVSGCAKSPAIRDVPPYETLLMVVADFRRFSQTDLYRHDIPKDISGQNIFRATLDRLDYFEQVNPGKDSDIVNFTRAQAYARLGRFAPAIEAYRRVRAVPGSPLSQKASERIDRLSEIEAVVAGASSPPGRLGLYLRELERKQEELDRLQERYAGAFDAVLVRREREKTDMEYALVLFRNRYVIENGAGRALDFLTDMIDRHATSRLVYAHRLTRGQFYLELARDLVVLTPPDRLGFDPALFEKLLSAAKREFLVVSRADGYDEKLEAAPLLDAAEALGQKVSRLSE